ncbi:MAG: hypothetical protein ABJD11_15905, partial [Gemmatimonadota bacterium]
MKRLWMVLPCFALAMPLAAQQNGVTSRVAASLDAKFIEASCQLKGGDFRTSSGKTYLKTGIETSVPENRIAALNNGKRVLLDAIQNNGASNSPAAWYWLGRIYLQQADLAG